MLVTCSACGNEVFPRSADQSCPSCGAPVGSTDATNPYAAPRAPIRDRRSSFGPYVPASGIAQVAATGIAVVTAVTCVQVVVALADLGAYRAKLLEAIRPTRQIRLTWVDFLGFAGGLAALVAGISFFMWFHRANRNARALGSGGMIYGPNAWGWFFCPILNLFRPYFAVRELHAAPRQATSVPGVFPAWWLTWLGSMVASLFGGIFVVMIGSEKRYPEMILLGQVLYVIAGVLAIRVILAIDRLHVGIATAEGGSGFSGRETRERQVGG